jgi:hypothetical protein
MKVAPINTMSSWRVGLALVGVLFLTTGCEIYAGGTRGESGELTFYEPNRYPADELVDAQAFELPIALGARAEVWTRSPGITTLERATIDDPEVLRLTLNGYPIRLRAESVGTTTLRVTTSSASDSLPLTVVRPDGARLWVIEPTFAPFGSYGPPYVLRPGATLQIGAQPMAGDQPLLGFDVFEWSINPDLLSDREDSTYVNTRRIEALGNAGVANLSTQLGGSLEVATLAPDDPISLHLHSIADGDSSLPELETLEPHDVPLFILVGRDAQGRIVLPSPDDDRDFEASITAGDIRLLDALRGGRFVELRACPGTGTISFSYLDSELSVPIEVTPDVASDACPNPSNARPLP